MRTLRRIMMVEDDPDIAVIGQIALEDIGGFNVLVCGSGAEALEKFSDFAPDLALFDYRLPGMNGDQLLIALRQHPNGRDIPVVFLTASAMPEQVRQLLALGASGLIAKPFDPNLLAAQLEGIWEKLQ